MSLEFGLAELLQRTKDDRLRPTVTFDIARWKDGRKAGSTATTIVDANGVGTAFGVFSVPRTGLYHILAHVSCGVAATPRLFDFRHRLAVTTGDVWAIRLAITSGRIHQVLNQELFLERNDELQFVTQTAMIAGDDLTGSIANWELVI